MKGRPLPERFLGARDSLSEELPPSQVTEPASALRRLGGRFRRTSNLAVALARQFGRCLCALGTVGPLKPDVLSGNMVGRFPVGVNWTG